MVEFAIFDEVILKPLASFYNPCVYGAEWPGCQEMGL